MSAVKARRIVVDCNVYVSLLIGGSIVVLRDHLISHAVELILSDKLLSEIEEQVSKTKFSKYFTAKQAKALLGLLAEVGTVDADTVLRKPVCRDPDDDYLLAL